MSEELKPCPFCDVVGAHYAHQHKEGCYFWLLDRGSRTETRVPVYLLRNAWNTRPGENALQTRAEEAGAEIERLRDALQKIADWSDAYPLDIFPEPDFKRVRELLKAGGETLDAVSASNMRHVIEGVGKIAKRALEVE